MSLIISSKRAGEDLCAENSSAIPHIDQKTIFIEQVHQVQEYTNIGLFVNLFLLPIYLFLMWKQATPSWLLISWAMLLLVILAIRGGVANRCRHSDLNKENASLWGRRFFFSALLNGAVLGAGGLILELNRVPEHPDFAVFIAGGLAVGAISTVSAVLAIYRAYVLPMTIPLALFFFLKGGADQLIMGILVSFFIVMMLVLSRRYSTYLVQAITLGFENRQVLEKLQVSEQRFHDVAMSSADWIWEVDTEGCYTYVSGGVLGCLGYEAQELLNKTPFELMPAEEVTRVAAVFSDLLARKAPIVDLENWNLTKTGRRVCMLTNGVPILDEQGGLTGYRGVDKDITDRKHIEKKLHEQRRELERIVTEQKGILGNTIVGIALIKDRHFFWCNQRLEEMLGYPNEEIIGDSTRKYFTSREDFEKVGKESPEFFAKGEAYICETLMQRKDGSRFWCHFSGKPIDFADLSAGIIYIMEDTTIRKQMEEELIEARQAAEMASRAKSDFLANMSHEIRTPMNAVLGLTHLALQTELTGKQSGYLKNIHSSARSLLGIINDILDFSKIEAGQLALERVPFQLSEVMNNLANIASVNAKEKDIEVLFDISQDIPAWLKGDPLRLGQVLINLVNNSVKFTKKGEVVISLRLVEQDEKQVTVHFSVWDSGIGMSPEQQTRLFQAFSQADTSISRKFGGTGLGLSICKRLVEMMGGEIHVQSEIEQGSEFSFSLIFDCQEPLKEEKTSGLEDLEELRVLVVDDNARAGMILNDMLSHMGAEVTLVNSGMEALSTLKATIDKEVRPYDLVFMDWKMPGMDGITASRKIREIKALPVTPVIIMLTAYGHERVRRQAKKVSIDAFLMKPVTPVVLAKTIRQVFGEVVEETAGAESVAPQVVAGLQGKRILLVEDNLLNQQVAYEILKGAGIEIELAEDGVQAVQGVKDALHPFDAILMDIMMPEMDGLEATHCIRIDLGETELPIIAMTASVMQNDLKACLDVGMNDVVAKPIDVDQLFSTLKKWIPTDGVDLNTTGEAGVDQKKTSHLLPDSLTTIDLQEGLKRLGGNEELLHRLLLGFKEDGHSICTNIRRALDRNEWQQAQGFTHEIKGVAGNLGVSRVYTLAEELELALKEREKEQFERLYAQLRQEVDTVRSELVVLATDEGKIISVPRRRGATTFDAEKTPVALREIYEMVKKNNLAAVQKIKELEEQLAGAGMDAILADIDSCMGKLDFSGAAEGFDELAQELDISIEKDI